MIRPFNMACLIFAFFLLGCDSRVLWTDGMHQVVEIDVPGNSELCYELGKGACIGRIGSVFEIGSNQRFIVVKSCPDSECSYFYLEKSRDDGFIDKRDLIKGPYSAKEYESTKATLGLPQLIELKSISDKD